MGMTVSQVTADGLVDRLPEELPALLHRGGLVWVDVPEWSDEVEAGLSGAFALHPLALQDCARRNQVPKVHVYPDHVFIVLHAPRLGIGGHVHYLELDQFVGPDFLISVHGPLNEAVPQSDAMVEVGAVRKRIASGRFRPTTAQELSHALVSALTGRLKDHTAELTRDVWRLEQAVTGNQYSDPEKFLDEMFRARHGLLTVKTMCTLSGEVYGRMAKVRVFGTTRSRCWTTWSTSSTGWASWPTARRTICRGRSSSTRPAPTPR
jgi:Mg2+ and Co2+ transporter CorA